MRNHQLPINNTHAHSNEHVHKATKLKATKYILWENRQNKAPPNKLTHYTIV